MIFVGIDWSSLHDDVCIIDEAGEIIKEFRVSVTSDGFSELLRNLDEFETDRGKMVIGIESGGNLISNYLYAAGCTVYSLNPLNVNRYKDRFKASAKKDDRFDAMNIAQFILSDRKRFEPLRPSSSEIQSLKLHCDTLDDLIRDRTRLINQLKANVMRYFPAFLSFFNDFRPNLPLLTLMEFAHPSKIAGLSMDEFQSRASKIKHFSNRRSSDFYLLIKEKSIVFENPEESALAQRSMMLAHRILQINEMIRETENTIKEIYAAHPLAFVFSSIPGAGERISPNLLSLMGDNYNRFKSYQQLQSYSGTSPVTKKSGKSFEIHSMRRACNKHFRYMLHTLSFTSLKTVPWVQDHYKSQRRSGKTHSSALRSVSNKWAKIIFSMWKNKIEYDAGKFEAKRCAA